MRIRRLLIGGLAALAVGTGLGFAATPVHADPGTTTTTTAEDCNYYKAQAAKTYDAAQAAKAAGDKKGYQYWMERHYQWKKLYDRCVN